MKNNENWHMDSYIKYQEREHEPIYLTKNTVSFETMTPHKKLNYIKQNIIKNEIRILIFTSLFGSNTHKIKQ